MTPLSKREITMLKRLGEYSERRGKWGWNPPQSAQALEEKGLIEIYGRGRYTVIEATAKGLEVLRSVYQTNGGQA